MIPSDGSEGGAPTPDSGRKCASCGHAYWKHVPGPDYVPGCGHLPTGINSPLCPCMEFVEPDPSAAPSLEVERAVKLINVFALQREGEAGRWTENASTMRAAGWTFDHEEALAAEALAESELLRALAARLPALEAENRQLATDLAAAHAAVDRGVAQLLTLHEDAALLRAERDEAPAKLAGFTAEDVARLRSIADRIEALPPPPSSKRDE